MDLSTTYLGLNLAHPIMTGASPMVDHLDFVRRLEDAGAAAITMHSLFEEQITREQQGMVYHMDLINNSHAEALSYFPQVEEFRLGPHQYLEQIRLIKQAVKIPVIASLNGTTAEGWLQYAKLIEQAGANALELNVYHVAVDPTEPGATVERRVLDIVREIKASVRMPIAVKLSPFYSSVSSCSTGSISPISTWPRWRWSRPSTSPPHTTCCCDCDGLPSCSVASRRGWRLPEGSIHPRMR
jgi:dihydroorotate dehydrogenase (fumarate)